jgi:hypothetical protein
MLGAAVRPTNRKPAVRHSRREQEGNYFSIFCSGRLGALGLDVPHARRWGRHCEVCQVESHSLFPLLLFFFFSLVVPLLLSGGRSFVLLLPPSSYGLSRTLLLVLLAHTFRAPLPRQHAGTAYVRSSSSSKKASKALIIPDAHEKRKERMLSGSFRTQLPFSPLRRHILRLASFWYFICSF